MDLSVWLGDTSQPAIETFVRLKMQIAFERFADRLRGGELRLSREEASGRLTRCSLDIKTHSNGIIHIDETGESKFGAISKAIRSAQAKLRNGAERRQSQGRKRSRFAKRNMKSMVRDEVFHIL